MDEDIKILLTWEEAETLLKVKDVTNSVHSGLTKSPLGKFTDLLIIGIGGSALGPQFVGKALGHPNTDKLKVHFFDNTDPDGIDHTLSEIGNSLSTTLVLVISKSGGTPETRNGMLEAARPQRFHWYAHLPRPTSVENRAILFPANIGEVYFRPR